MPGAYIANAGCSNTKVYWAPPNQLLLPKKFAYLGFKFMPIIADISPASYEEAVSHLSSLDSDWKRHIAEIGPCRHQAKPAREPYEALVRAIAYQQLHAKAGDAILGRLLSLYPDALFPSPAQLLETAEDSQRACGFSAAKLATIRGIAQAAIDGLVPTRAEATLLSDDQLIERLISLRG